MSYFDPDTVVRLTSARERELLKGLANRQLLEEARANRPRLYGRIFLNIGEFFIFVGLKMRARYTPVGQRELVRSLR